MVYIGYSTILENDLLPEPKNILDNKDDEYTNIFYYQS